jgi:hypothetical protein
MKEAWPPGATDEERAAEHGLRHELFIKLGLHVRGSPEPDGTSSERSTTVSSAISLHWSRIPDPLVEFKS